MIKALLYSTILALPLLVGCQDTVVGPGEAMLASASDLRIDGADQGGRPLSATLLGSSEVPGPGDPDGSGTAIVTLNQGQQQVCFRLEVEDIAPAFAAHIHVGAAGMNGPVVIGLAPPSDGSSTGCVSDVAPDLIRAIRKNPGDYYVNIHNADFPPGALRGQLGS